MLFVQRPRAVEQPVAERVLHEVEVFLERGAGVRQAGNWVKSFDARIAEPGAFRGELDDDDGRAAEPSERTLMFTRASCPPAPSSARRTACWPGCAI